MLHGKLYYILLVLCWIYALLRGGLPERIGTTILAVGSTLTVAAVSNLSIRFGSVELGIFVVDMATLVGFVALALRAERYWPLWLAALQLIGTAGHAVKLADPDIIRRAYAVALVFWSYPMLLLLAGGTWRHQRRLALYGVDKSWSIFSARSGRAPPAGPIG